MHDDDDAGVQLSYVAWLLFSVHTIHNLVYLDQQNKQAMLSPQICWDCWFFWFRSLGAFQHLGYALQETHCYLTSWFQVCRDLEEFALSLQN